MLSCAHILRVMGCWGVLFAWRMQECGWTRRQGEERKKERSSGGEKCDAADINQLPTGTGCGKVPIVTCWKVGRRLGLVREGVNHVLQAVWRSDTRRR